MSTSSVFRARARALRTEARYAHGMARARLLSRAVDCERLAGSYEAIESPAPEITTLRMVGGRPALTTITAGGPIEGWAGRRG